MIHSQTYFLLDGQVLTLRQWPTTTAPRKLTDGPPKHILRLPFEEESVVEVEPIPGLPDSWRQLGIQGAPPRPNDSILEWEIPLRVIDLPLESAIQRGRWLVQTIIGLLWIVRAFDTLPIWKLAPEHSTCP